tara:strand:+ start:1530 stop:2114 length:585 start_codon:yes stop_codon:yes gene_type:complete
MALQSSGQISLSQIAAEFGGSVPHSLSEYYGLGNAPSSGEIQLAADFYGTSGVSFAANTTITIGSRNSIKGGEGERGMDDLNPSIGSIASRAISNSSNQIDHVFFKLDSTPKKMHFNLATSTSYTAWTFIEIEKGDGTKTRFHRTNATLGSHGTTGAIFHTWTSTSTGSGLNTTFSADAILGSTGTTINFRIAI